MVRGRCLGATASVSPRHSGTNVSMLNDPFSFFEDHCEWFCSPLCRHQSVGSNSKGKVGLHDFCQVVTNFHMQAFMQAWLNTLSLVWALDDVEKPQWDMAFLLIAPSLAIRCKRVFGLVAVRVHLAKPTSRLSRRWLVNSCYWWTEVQTGHMPS